MVINWTKIGTTPQGEDVYQSDDGEVAVERGFMLLTEPSELELEYINRMSGEEIVL